MSRYFHEHSFAPSASDKVLDFEPIRDYEENANIMPHHRDLANYEDFLRRETPRFFNAALEDAVTREIHPIEERLRRQILDLIREAQNQAFLSWRAIQDPNLADSSTASATISTQSNPLQERVVPTISTTSSHPEQRNFNLVLNMSDSGSDSRNSQGSISSDSGYNSDLIRPTSRLGAISEFTRESTEEQRIIEENLQINIATDSQRDVLNPRTQHTAELLLAPHQIDSEPSSVHRPRLEHLLAADDPYSCDLDSAQEASLEGSLMLTDESWAVNLDNLDLDCADFDASWGNAIDPNALL
jgi:hypothetical protein